MMVSAKREKKKALDGESRTSEILKSILLDLLRDKCHANLIKTD